MLLKRRKPPKKPEARCCPAWSMLKTIIIKGTRRWLRDCTLLWSSTAGFKGMVDMKWWGKSSWWYELSHLLLIHLWQNCSSSHKSEWNSKLFNFFPVPSSICITSNSPIFPTMFFHPFLPFFLPPLFCVLDRGQHTPSILFMDQQKESYSLCEMFLHYPISLTVWCVGRRELFGCCQHINRGAESCHSSSSAVCQHSWSTEVSRLKHQTETCTLGDHPH